jgi:hypothetical protein
MFHQVPTTQTININKRINNDNLLKTNIFQIQKNHTPSLYVNAKKVFS